MRPIETVAAKSHVMQLGLDVLRNSHLPPSLNEVRFQKFDDDVYDGNHTWC